MSTNKIVFGILFLILISTVFMSFLLPPVNNNAQINHHFDTDDATIHQLLANLDVDDASIYGAELKKRINELLRIKGSVQKELMSKENRRSQMQKQKAALEKEIENVKKEATNHKIQLGRKVHRLLFLL